MTGEGREGGCEGRVGVGVGQLLLYMIALVLTCACMNIYEYIKPCTVNEAVNFLSN